MADASRFAWPISISSCQCPPQSAKPVCVIRPKRRKKDVVSAVSFCEIMKIEAIAKLVYGFFGAVFLVVGATVMLLHTGLLPETIKNIVIDFAHGDMLAVHLIQELASILVFAGLITFWFIRHYEHSKAYHWAMTTFWALIAFAHWFDGREGPRSVNGPLINTIPFMVFLLIGFLRWNSERNLRVRR